MWGGGAGGDPAFSCGGKPRKSSTRHLSGVSAQGGVVAQDGLQQNVEGGEDAGGENIGGGEDAGGNPRGEADPAADRDPPDDPSGVQGGGTVADRMGRWGERLTRRRS